MNAVDVKKEDGSESGGERRFAQIPPETVSLIGESLGITNLPESITRSLSEDASYRCREIVHFCTQFLRHGKRRKLTTNDFNRALRWYDVGPIFGQGSETCPNFLRIPEAEVYVPDEEKPVNLINYSLSNTSHEIGEDPIIKGFWLSIEGTALPLHTEDSKPIEHPQPNHITPNLLQYYTSVTNVILGNSEEMLKIVLDDLKANSKISTLLPYFVTFIRNTLQKHCDNTVITGRLLYFLQSLFSNGYFNLSPKPYLSHLVTGLLSSLIIERRSREISEADKLTLKIEHVPLASRILRGVLDRWATPVNLLRSQTLRALREYLKDTKLSYSSQYGALSALIALGPEVLEDTLLPLLNSYYLSLESKFQSPSGRRPVLLAEKERLVLVHMMGQVLSASKIILAYRSSHPESIILSKVPIKDEVVKKEPGTINEIATSLSDFYRTASDNFGDALCDVPLCRILKEEDVQLGPPSLQQQKVKFVVRKWVKTGIFSSSSSKTHHHESSVSKELEDPSDNIFSSSQNFDHLAHMGVPSDIFDETSNDGFMDVSVSGGNNGPEEAASALDRIPLSTGVLSEFEPPSKYVALRYPKITFYYGRCREVLVRRSFGVEEDLRPNSGKRGSFIGRRLGGSFYSEDQRRVMQNHSLSLHTSIL